MNIYIEDYIEDLSFLGFKIGQHLDLSLFTEGKHYNTIGSHYIKSGYYFFDREIDIEVCIKNDKIDSFDILMKNQENKIFLGHRATNLCLNTCELQNFLIFLSGQNIFWKFESIVGEKAISIAFNSKLKFTLCFDFDEHIKGSLSLISLHKIQ